MPGCKKCGDKYEKTCPKCQEWLEGLKRGDSVIVRVDWKPYHGKITQITSLLIYVEVTDCPMSLPGFHRENGESFGFGRYIQPPTPELEEEIKTRLTKEKVIEKLNTENPKTMQDLAYLLITNYGEIMRGLAYPLITNFEEIMQGLIAKKDRVNGS